MQHLSRAGLALPPEQPDESVVQLVLKNLQVVLHPHAAKYKNETRQYSCLTPLRVHLL